MENLRHRPLQVALALAVLCGWLGLPAGASPEGAKRLGIFKEAFQSPSAEVRQAAVEDLVDAEDLEVCKRVVSEVFKDPESVVVQAGVRLLGKVKNQACLDWLLQSPVKSENAQVRTLTLEALGRMGGMETTAGMDDPRIVEILEARLTDPHWLVAATAARSLGDRKSVASVAKIRTLLQHKDQRVRVSGCDVLAQLGDAGSWKELARLITEDKEWRVKSAACDALRALKATEALSSLRSQAQKEDGRLKDDLRAAIQALQQEGEKKDGDEELKGYGIQYHGIGSNSKRVVFILDCSTSMGSPLGYTTKRPELEEGCEATKLGVCQSELIRAVQQIGKAGGKFNMIFVHSQNDVWQKTLLQAAPEKVELATKHIKRQKASGRTNLCDALLTALEIEDGGAVDLKPEEMKEAADTVFILSDGGEDSNEGKYKRLSDILEVVRGVNRYARVRIHAITTGEARFLKDLTGENQGTFASKVAF